MRLVVVGADAGGMSAAHQALNAFAMADQKVQAPLLLLGISQYADEHHSRVEIPGDVDIIHGH